MTMSHGSSLESTLLQLHVEALFTHDSKERLLSTNEIGPVAAPRFYLARTTTGHLWRVRHDVPDTIARSLVELAASEPASSDLSAAPRHLDAYRELLESLHPVDEVSAGPAFFFPDEVERPENVVTIDPTNAHLLHPFGFSPYELAVGLESGRPFTAIVEDGVARSMCHCARFTDRAAEAGVRTLADFQGRGYAPAVVAAWALAVRAVGRIPLYSTSWSNLRSRAVARRLGLVTYGAEWSLL
ncbi:hypothetical protein [Pendulispora albinea]|uniref:GNAT family N-acetyltransferase n=1 Tax=Pendulispora albinea TaxID=2741071 RepID=A0ABZ2M7N3_9BACT